MKKITLSVTYLYSLLDIYVSGVNTRLDPTSTDTCTSFQYGYTLPAGTFIIQKLTFLLT